MIISAISIWNFSLNCCLLSFFVAYILHYSKSLLIISLEGDTIFLSLLHTLLTNIRDLVCRQTTFSSYFKSAQQVMITRSLRLTTFSFWGTHRREKIYSCLCFLSVWYVFAVFSVTQIFINNKPLSDIFRPAKPMILLPWLLWILNPLVLLQIFVSS